MKNKVIGLILALALFTVPAMAVEVSVAPQATYHVYSGDLKNAVGGGFNVSVKDALVDNLVLFSGLEAVSADFDSSRTFATAVKVSPFGSASFNSTVQDSLDQVIWSNGVGYAVKAGNIDLLPFVSVDSYFINSDTINVDNTVGVTTGVKASYAIKENVSVFTGVQYSWASADSSVGSIDLDNFGLVGGATVKF